MDRYVALLRGINVGGKNLIRMADLKACFEAQGFRDVATFIQSGNVLFASDDSGRPEMTRRIEQALSATFEYQACVVVRSRREIKAIVRRAPQGFGAQPARYRYDVLFLKEPLTASAAVKDVPLQEGVDEAWAGAGVLYFSRLISRASASRLNRITSLPIYQSLTIRNWNTTTTLLRLLEAAGR